MSRLSVLIQRPKRTLGALATVLVAVGVTAASGADFTATSANPSNTYAAGTLSMVNSKSGSAILSLSNMRPDAPAQNGTVDIQNTGSLSGTFSLARQAPVDSDSSNPMSAKLDLVVTDCGAWGSGGTVPNPCGDAGEQQVYSGTIAAMSSSLPLGSFAANEKHTYQFAVKLNGSADNAYQGDSSTVRFDWTAAS